MMTGATGLEPATSAVTGQRSNQLSYAPARTPAYPNMGEDAVTGTKLAGQPGDCHVV
jgi:hypothetical protein